jgi:hypothetical protein
MWFGMARAKKEATIKFEIPFLFSPYIYPTCDTLKARIICQLTPGKVLLLPMARKTSVAGIG